MTEVEVSIAGLMMDSAADAEAPVPVVLLKSLTEDWALPIWIGLPEGVAIATVMKGESVDRPMTHDLLQQTVSALGAEVQRVHVRGIIGGTYLATIEVLQGGRKILIDSRPSDALALAVRVRCGIFVELSLFESAKVEVTRVEPSAVSVGLGETGPAYDDSDYTDGRPPPDDQENGGAELLTKLKKKDFKFTM